MKYLLMIILAIYLNANDWRDINTRVEASGYDYTIHYTVGALASYYTYEYLPNNMSETEKTIISIAVPILIGLAKESTDVNFHLQDVTEYGAGGVVGITLQFAF